MEEQERTRAEDRGSGGGKGNRVWVQGQRGGALNRGAEMASVCGPREAERTKPGEKLGRGEKNGPIAGLG